MSKRRIYLDLEEEVADAAKDIAHELRIPTKRYIEGLIEIDVKNRQQKKGGAKKANGR